jgi:hypothetical protein
MMFKRFQNRDYICDGCGEEHRDEAPRLKLTLNRCDAVMNFIVERKRVEAISEGGELHFCGINCLRAYFGSLVDGR